MCPAISTSSNVPSGRGAIAMAAYRPDPELFAVQLRSIRDQSREDFVCLIGADGNPDEVARLVRESVPGDDRFCVLGWDDRLGFYANFERVLKAVPKDCAWVALSDQDDDWRADKLEKLVPLLSRHSLVSGQARVITPGAAQVLVEKTDRRVVPPEALLMHNQVSGALSVFRRELLDLALPFPRFHISTQLHDHWLAMCAVAFDGYMVLDEVVQDYVQHGSNVIGEAGQLRGRKGPFARARTVRDLAAQYESGTRARHYIRVCRNLSFGWREAMVTALLERVTHPRTWLIACDQRTHSRTGLAVRTIMYGLRSSDVHSSTTLTFVAGLPGELLLPRKTR